MIINLPFQDMFKIHADIYVNAINCDGIMGGGVAALFKKRFPHSYNLYKQACNVGDLCGGDVFVTKEKNLTLYHAATKQRIYNNATLDYVNSCIENMADLLEVENKPKIIVCPSLGAGLGNLSWDRVKPLFLMSRLATNKHAFLLIEPGE